MINLNYAKLLHLFEQYTQDFLIFYHSQTVYMDLFNENL
jgi:hypothetical protein